MSNVIQFPNERLKYDGAINPLFITDLQNLGQQVNMSMQVLLGLPVSGSSAFAIISGMYYSSGAYSEGYLYMDGQMYYCEGLTEGQYAAPSVVEVLERNFADGNSRNTYKIYYAIGQATQYNSHPVFSGDMEDYRIHIGNRLGKKQNLSDLDSASEARTNLAVYSTTQVDDIGNLKLAKAQNLSDLANKADARTNLGVYSTTQVDDIGNLKLAKAQNLADVANVDDARTNLDVYSQDAVDIFLYQKMSKSQSLADVANVDDARANLSVYSKAETYTQAQVNTIGANAISTSEAYTDSRLNSYNAGTIDFTGIDGALTVSNSFVKYRGALRQLFLKAKCSSGDNNNRYVGQANVHPTSEITVAGVSETVTDYEHGSLLINTDGTMYVKTGKANKYFSFNCVYM